MDKAQAFYAIITAFFLAAGVALLWLEHPLAGGACIAWAIISHMMMAAAISADARARAAEAEDSDGAVLPKPAGE